MRLSQNICSHVTCRAVIYIEKILRWTVSHKIILNIYMVSSCSGIVISTNLDGLLILREDIYNWFTLSEQEDVSKPNVFCCRGKCHVFGFRWRLCYTPFLLVLLAKSSAIHHGIVSTCRIAVDLSASPIRVTTDKLAEMNVAVVEDSFTFGSGKVA